MAKMNATTFSAEAFGKTYSFTCHAMIGKNGLTHVCKDDEGRTTRKVWEGRTWEPFEFACVLQAAIKKCPAKARPVLEARLIEGTRQAAEKKADDELAEFQAAYDKLDDRNKELMREYPLLQNEEDVQRCMGFMRLLALFQEL